jgi:hypothetical protein
MNLKIKNSTITANEKEENSRQEKSFAKAVKSKESHPK